MNWVREEESGEDGDGSATNEADWGRAKEDELSNWRCR